MATRVVHRVRCRKKDNKRIWADVKVVDAFTVVTPGGKEMLLWTRAKDANPCIVDKTKGGNEKGSPNSCTRISHMELVSSPDDSKTMMYVEKLDGISFQPPKFHPSDTTGTLDNQEKRAGLPEPATFGKGPYAITCPEKKAVKLIVDDTGLGADESNSNPSRSMHVSMVTEKGNTDDKTDEADAAPPKKQSWLAVAKVDAMNVQVPTGNITMLINKGIQREIDWTEETTDEFTHEPCPPDNKDPNVYVDFPTADTDGNSIGAGVHIPDGGPIDQGPLWWIERISPGFRPWFWYTAPNTPLAFSFFGSPGRLGNWPWRGFILWNNYPVIWLLSRNNPLVPMGSFGSFSLEASAERMSEWDISYPNAPSDMIFAPPHQVSLFPFAGLSFVPVEFLIPQEGPSDPFYAPYGPLPMTKPPIPTSMLGMLSGPASGIGNVWQLTGRTQPPLTDPTHPWEPFNNPYTPPSPADAEACAREFEANWNAAANGHNGFLKGLPGQTYTTPPGWSWAVPYNYLSAYAFHNGIPPNLATPGGLPLVVFTPATAWTMGVDQLDPKIWDDTHLEYYNNPLNAFFPIVLPPFRWDADPWLG